MAYCQSCYGVVESLLISPQCLPHAFRFAASSAKSDKDNLNGWSSMTSIFVGNLSYSTREEDLLATFSQFGNVERVNVVTDRDSGQPRGFAFVEMMDDDAANKAIEALNGTNLGGRNLNINEARPKTDRPRGGGGGGRGGYGGGGGGRDRGRSGGGGGGWGRR